MQTDKILSALGLARKAGQIASGEYAVEKAVKKQLAFLVIVALDASDNTKKKMRNMTAFYDTPLYFYSSKEMLGKCIGQEYRSMVAVMNEGFASSIEKQLKQDRTTE